MIGEPRTDVVFGGAGFIGSHLCAFLRDENPNARIVVADVGEAARPVSGVDYRTVDVRAPIPDGLAEPTGRVVIYNLAAVHRTPGHPTHEYYETNVRGAINISDFARRIGCGELVFTSSIAVYGPDEARKTEESRPAPTSAYGWSKWLAEQVHQSWRNEAPGRRLTIVRPAVIFGPGERGNFTRLGGALRRGTFFFAGRRDTIKGCGYVGELARAINFVHSNNDGEAIFNFCYDHDYSIEEICDTFVRVGGVKKPWGTVPLSLMMMGGFSFEILNTIGLRNSINRDRIRKLVDSTNIDPALLRRMQYVYETDLEEGLRRWQAAEPQGDFV